ncbi:hypothetical protein ISCGN_003821 [Ixodes scapularis]
MATVQELKREIRIEQEKRVQLEVELRDLIKRAEADVEEMIREWESKVESVARELRQDREQRAELDRATDFLKGFFQDNRRTYRDERKKILKTKSGQAAEEAYSRKWKFFSALRFLGGATSRAGIGMSSSDFAEAPLVRDSDEWSPEDALSPGQSPEPSSGAASGAGPSLAEKESASAPPPLPPPPPKKKKKRKERECERGRLLPHDTEDGRTYKTNRVHGSTTTSTRRQCCVWHGGGRIFTVDVSASEG